MAALNYEHCSEITKQPQLPLDDKGAKLTINNPDRIPLNKITVDGCLITDHRSRCDFIVEIPSTNRAIFVELKGCDVDKAIKQISATIGHTKSRFGQHKKTACIASSRVPKNDSRIDRLRKKLFKEHSALLETKKRKGDTLDINKLR